MSAAPTFPPDDGIIITNFLVVSDQDRSRGYYHALFNGEVLRERDPVILKVANTWLILNEGAARPTTSQPSSSPRRRIRTRSAASSTSASLTSSGHTGSCPPREPSSSPNRKIMVTRSGPTSATPTDTSSRLARRSKQEPLGDITDPATQEHRPYRTTRARTARPSSPGAGEASPTTPWLMARPYPMRCQSLERGPLPWLTK